jgi:hypothetical protein
MAITKIINTDTPAGSNTEVQYNDNGVFGSSSNLTFSGSVLAVTGAVTMANAAGPTIVNEAATATNPTLIPNKAEVDTGYGWAAADTLTAITGGTERMRIDSAGLVTIKNTGNTGLIVDGSAQSTGVITQLQILDGDANPATISSQQVGGKAVMGFIMGGSQRMQINSDGNVGIGNSAYTGGSADPAAAPPTGSGVGPGTAGNAAKILKVDGGENVDAGIQIVGHSNPYGMDLWTDVSTGDVYIDQRGDNAAYDMHFRTRTTGTPITAMTITGSGQIGFGKVPANKFEFLETGNGSTICQFQNSAPSTPNGIDIDFSATTPDNTTQWFVRGQDSAAMEFHIYSDGSFAQASDIKLKENVIPTGSHCDGLKTLEVIEYNKIKDVKNALHIGFSAQEVQKVYPHLVSKAQFDEEFDDDGNLIEREDQLMLNTIGLVPILWRNVQELEARLASLEAA